MTSLPLKGKPMRFLVASLVLGLCSLVCPSVEAQFASPSPEHEVLKKDVGTWKAKMTMWEGEGEPAMEAEGVETNRMMGDFWIVSTFKMDFGGMPFEGHGTNGYDPKTEKFVGSWVDSTSPYAMHMTGTYDEKTSTFTFKSEGLGPDGQPTKGKSVIVYKDDDHRTFTMYDIVDGKEVKKMVVEYERTKK